MAGEIENKCGGKRRRVKKFAGAIFPLLMAISGAAFAGSDRDETEKTEVREIFKALMLEMKRDLPSHFGTKCIFGPDWQPAQIRDGATGDFIEVNPIAKLTKREALDPEHIYSAMFCDRDQRNTLAKDAGKRGEGDGPFKAVQVYDVDWSYPVFNEALTSATVTYSYASQKFGRGKGFVTEASGGFIHFVKSAAGEWTFEFEQTGVS